MRALARVDLGAIERNCARLAAVAAPAAAVRGRQGRRLRPRRGAGRARRAGGRRAWLAVATAGEAAELRAAGIEGPLLVMGALSAEELDVALEAGADVVAWREEFVASLPERSRRARQARHRHGPARHARPDEASRVVATAAAGPARRAR